MRRWRLVPSAGTGPSNGARTVRCSGAAGADAASRTAFAKARRSSGPGWGGEDGIASRMTSQPLGTVSDSACCAHRS